MTLCEECGEKEAVEMGAGNTWVCHDCMIQQLMNSGIDCDNCGKFFRMNSDEAVLENTANTSTVYCPHCNHEHVWSSNTWRPGLITPKQERAVDKYADGEKLTRNEHIHVQRARRKCLYVIKHAEEAQDILNQLHERKSKK